MSGRVCLCVCVLGGVHARGAWRAFACAELYFGVCALWMCVLWRRVWSVVVTSVRHA